MIKQIHEIKNNITLSGKTIYDNIEIGDHEYWYTEEQLEFLLNNTLVGEDVTDMPNRTRSKHVNQLIAKYLGYPVPKSFKRVNPRFLGQNFDVYNQKSNNLQIWNEEIEPARRYVMIKISENDIITKVKVVNGKELEVLDKTGTLTGKYQANLKPQFLADTYIIGKDTNEIRNITRNFQNIKVNTSPSSFPEAEHLMSIEELSKRIKTIQGLEIPYFGADQERKRGDALHNLISKTLGYNNISDTGDFPDIRNQLVEVKLQTSPTVDLGMTLPSSSELLSIPQIDSYAVKMSDVRFVIVYGDLFENTVRLNKIILISGADFFNYYNQFKGIELNQKIQLPLPNNFFD